MYTSIYIFCVCVCVIVHYFLHSLMSVFDNVLVVKILLWKRVGHKLNGVWVDDWLGYICNLLFT